MGARQHPGVLVAWLRSQSPETREGVSSTLVTTSRRYLVGM